jgi:hypothetical protein
MNFQEQEERDIEERMRNMRKIILIENLDNLGISGNSIKKFIKFYYNNLDLNLLQALESFKHEKI